MARRRLLRPAQPRAGCATERTHFGPPGSGKNLLPPQVRREAKHMPHPACPARRLLRPAFEAGPQREDRPPSACFLRSPQTLAVRAISRGLSAAAALHVPLAAATYARPSSSALRYTYVHAPNLSPIPNPTLPNAVAAAKRNDRGLGRMANETTKAWRMSPPAAAVEFARHGEREIVVGCLVVWWCV